MRIGRYRYIIKRLAALLLVCVLLVPASAADLPLSGKIENKAWVYDRNTKTMTLFPADEAATREYSEGAKIYWRDDEYNPYHNKAYETFYHWGAETEHVVYEEGITAVGDGYEVCIGSHECGSELSGFVQCKDIKLPISLQIIGAGAFENLPSLQSVTLNEGLHLIGESAFSDSKLKSIVIPSSVKEISEAAFRGCSLERISLNEGLEIIGSDAFAYTKLKEIIIPNSIEEIDNGAFNSCNNLKKVTFPSKLKRSNFYEDIIGERLFEDCKKLEKVTLPSNIKRIPSGMFIGCRSLKNVTLPKSLRVIEPDVFMRSGVETVTIPKNVTNLCRDWVGDPDDGGMFRGCKGIKKVNITTRRLNKIGSDILSHTPRDTVFVVPKGMKKKYTKLLRKGGLSKRIKIKESKKW